MFPVSTYSFFMVGLLQAMGMPAEPSLIRTLPGACGLSSLQDEVQTLPGVHVHSLWWVPTLPGQCAHALHWRVPGWSGDWESFALLSTFHFLNIIFSFS